VMFPQFRSKQRDVRSDIERLSAVEDAIARVIEDVEQEQAGLAARIAEARKRATALYGEMIEDESPDTAAATAMLNDAERVLVRGDVRLIELRTNLAFLNDLRRSTASESERLQAYSADGE
jgi:hypothetical protein